MRSFRILFMILERLLETGDNHFEIEVTNTLHKSLHDTLSEFYFEKPIGITGGVYLVAKK